MRQDAGTYCRSERSANTCQRMWQFLWLLSRPLTIVFPKCTFTPFPPWRALLNISPRTSDVSSSCMTWASPLLFLETGPSSLGWACSMRLRPPLGTSSCAMLCFLVASYVGGRFHSAIQVDWQQEVGVPVKAWCRRKGGPFGPSVRAGWTNWRNTRSESGVCNRLEWMLMTRL